MVLTKSICELMGCWDASESKNWGSKGCLHIYTFTRRTFTLVSGWRHYLADFTLDLLGYWKGHGSICFSLLAYDLLNPQVLPGEGLHPTATPEGGTEGSSRTLMCCPDEGRRHLCAK